MNTYWQRKADSIKAEDGFASITIIYFNHPIQTKY